MFGCFVGFLCGQQFIHLSLNHVVFNLLEEQLRFSQLMAGREQVGTAQLVPVKLGHVEHLAQLGAAEGKERLEGDAQVGSQLQGNVEDGLYAFGVTLHHFPGFAVGQVLITDAGQVHGFLLGVAEFEDVEQLLHLLLHVGKLAECFAVGVGQFATGRHYAVVVLFRQLQGTVHKVAIHGHQLVVVAGLEILPGKVVIFGLGRVGREHIAQHVLFTREVLQVFVQPYSPVARGRNLVTLQVEELVRGYVVGHDVVAMGLHHDGEDEAMEYDVVLADEVDKACLGVLPPLLPAAPALGLCIAELFGVRDVADGCVEPDVEHLTFSTLYGHRDTPFQVTRHGTWLQVHVEPRLTLAINVGAPFLVTLQNPLAQPLLILSQGEVPVLGGAFHQAVARVVLVGGVNQLLGREGGTTLLTLVAVGTLGTTAGAGTHDIAVGQEFTRDLVAELLLGNLLQLAFVIELAEEVRGKLVVDAACRAAIDVERDTELLERALDERVVTVNHLLGSDALFAGTDGDGHAMFIATANKNHLLFLQAEVAHVDVSGYINAGQVADVYRTVGVGQGRRHGGTFELLFHIVLLFLVFLFACWLV